MTAEKKRVLFVCVGNCCRSQMAEGFAGAYGSDMLEPHSAGIFPAGIVVQETVECMAEKNIDISGQFSKGLGGLDGDEFDLIVNLSGQDLPWHAGQSRTWPVEDPIGKDRQVYRSTRDQIEALVQSLIAELRTAKVSTS